MIPSRHDGGGASVDQPSPGVGEPGSQNQKEKDLTGQGSIPIDTAWFKNAIRARETSQRQVAFKMGLDPAGMSLLLRGHRKMSVAEAAELAELLGKPLEEVIARAGGSAHLVGNLRTPSQIAAVGGANVPPRPSPDSGTVLGHVLAATNIEVVGWIDGRGTVHKERAAGPGHVERPPGVPAGSVALRLQSQDMWDGWIVFFRPGRGVGAEAVGQMCVIEREDGATQLRFVSRGYEQGKWNVGGGLWDREDDVALRSASPVLWMKQR